MTSTPTLSNGSGYAGGNATNTQTGQEGSATEAATTVTPGETKGYPNGGGSETKAPSEEGTQSNEHSGTQIATPKATKVPNTSGTGGTLIGWLVGLFVGVGILGGGAWYLLIFRKKQKNSSRTDDFFKDDPEN